jgi:hypothetical protein
MLETNSHLMVQLQACWEGQLLAVTEDGERRRGNGRWEHQPLKRPHMSIACKQCGTAS